MFFILSKILYVLVAPLTWIVLALLIALFSKKVRRKRIALIVTASLLLLFTNPFLSNEAWLLWEHPPKSIASLPTYDAAIIFTGLTNQDKTPHDRIYTNKGADRVLHTVQLYKLGKCNKIIVSGGMGSLRDKFETEATSLKRILLNAGVPDSAILLEERARNTHENAKFTKELLMLHPELKKVLLVTSAFHMRRSDGCMKKAGVVADTFPADFYTTDRLWTFDRLIVPNEWNLYMWQKLLHEITGYVTYKLMGYC